MYPNLEVQTSLNAYLCGALVADRNTQNGLSVRLYDLLMANDFCALRELFHAFFASIPNDWYRSNTIARYEGYYASVFYAYFASLGLDIVAEESSNAGRLDMAVRFNGQVYLFEFKVMELEPDGRALQQIKDRGYADKYRAEGVPIHLIGIEFSRERRGLVGFEVESLPRLITQRHKEAKLIG